VRLAIDPRRWRLFRRLPRYSLLSLTEIVLLALLAVQGARLVRSLLPTRPHAGACDRDIAVVEAVRRPRR
jgi:general secretion pathway protein C